ncbi:MAG TPA: PQQ-binding-like beta-propeller repeat protein [Acidimicrobiia bacterium]
MRRRVRLLVAAALVLVASACTWPQFKFGASREGSNPFEVTINSANVAGLNLAWSRSTGLATAPNDPVVAGRNAFFTVGDTLDSIIALDTADGSTRWSAPLPQAAPGFGVRGTPPVADGSRILVGLDQDVGVSGSHGGVAAYDADTGRFLAEEEEDFRARGGLAASVNGQLYQSFHVFLRTGETFDGVHGPGFDVLSTTGTPAVRAGVLYVRSTAFTSSTCGSSPQWPIPVCSPTWSGTAGDTVPAVTATTLYVGDDDGHLYAFPSDGCGGSTCAPLWSGSTGGAVKSSPAVGGGVVAVGSDDGKVYAFPDGGCGQATCAPLWTASLGAPVATAPAIANGLVFVTATDGRLAAFTLGGCGQPTCAPLWTTDVPAQPGAPTVASGRVIVSAANGNIYAYGLASH